VNEIAAIMIFLIVALFPFKEKAKNPGLYFRILPASQTAIDFKNTIVENDCTNMFVNEYTYMGGRNGYRRFYR